MQIMEDVREGCNVQPSSPGHADQRIDDDVQIKSETTNENGCDHNNHNGQPEIKLEDDEINQKEENKSDSDNEDKHEECISNGSSNQSDRENHKNKRKLDREEPPIKRLRMEIQENFTSRDKILNEFIEMADCNNLEQIQTFSEQILAEIKTLNDIAKEKEREWNNILHLKKIKEELLIRMQRKRHVLVLSDGELIESQNEHNNSQGQSLLKLNQKSMLRIPNIDKNRNRNVLPRPQMDLNSALDFRQNRQRPILDVQSIIADYRQRHPEAVPRRGRRIRSSVDGKSSILNLSSGAFGSGAQVKQNLQGVDVSSELGILLGQMNGSKDGSQQCYQDNNTSFKDMLVQFARLSQNERNELIQNAIKPPPPYPEVTVHPVPTAAAPTNSLLHGILTKTPTKQQKNNNANNSANTNGNNNNNNNNSKTAFSPTLARLLTAPERANNHVTSTPMMQMGLNAIHPNNMSISEILSTSKARNEITITPVGSQYETTPTKGDCTVEEESEEGADRLVIDESSETANSRSKDDTGSEAGDEVPQCQGCNQKSAQFVCAGCGNQWYCSRDCQVSAWDEHSEVCSG